MNTIQALLLGILQGLTEFLPISSSGHIEIAKKFLHIDPEGSLIFTIAVHGATVLAIIVVFYKDILSLFSGLFKFKWNESARYIAMILVSMIPAVIVGLFLKDVIERTYSENLPLIGINLIITAALLFTTTLVKRGNRELTFLKAFVIGIAQAASAGLRGVSRSGSTISTGLLMKIEPEKVARFSFLMVLIPVIGENVLDLYKGNFTHGEVPVLSLVIGFVAAFAVGLMACKWMIGIVRKGKLAWFALYCLALGLFSIVAGIVWK